MFRFRFTAFGFVSVSGSCPLGSQSCFRLVVGSITSGVEASSEHQKCGRHFGCAFGNDEREWRIASSLPRRQARQTRAAETRARMRARGGRGRMRWSRRRPAWTNKKTVCCCRMPLRRHAALHVSVDPSRLHASACPCLVHGAAPSMLIRLLSADNEDFLETLFTARRIGDRRIIKARLRLVLQSHVA